MLRTLAMHDWRSIMLQNLVSKHHHAFLRTRLYALINSALHVTQTGGIKGRGTDLSAAMLRWALAAFTDAGISAIIFCVYGKSAFYTMLREIVMPMAASSDDFETIINSIGIPLPFVQPLSRL